MPLNNILPTYQAEERSAQVRVHPVYMPNGFKDIGDNIANAGQGIQKAAFGLVFDLKREQDALREKEDNLLLTERMNLISEETTKYATELLKTQGRDAAGISAKMEKFYEGMKRKYFDGLKPESMRRLGIFMDQDRLSKWKVTQGHEYEQTYKAEVNSKTALVNNQMSSYAIFGGSDQLAQLEGSAKELFRATHGAVIDERSMEAFDADVKAGRARAEGRAQMESRNQEWNEFWSNIKDQAVAGHFQQLLDTGDIKGATEFYNDNQSKLSEAAKAKLQPVLEKTQKHQVNVQAGQAIWADVKTKGGPRSVAGRYWTEELTLADAEKVQELSRDTSEDGKVKLHAYLEARDAAQAVMKSNAVVDLSQRTRSLRLDDTVEGHTQNLYMLDKMLPTMDDSQLKDRLQEIRNDEEDKLRVLQNREKAEQAEEAAVAKAQYTAWKNNPVRQAKAGIIRAMAATSNHTVTIDGEDYDLRDPARRQAFKLYQNWLTDEDWEVIDAYVNGELASDERMQAAYDITQFLKVLNTKEDWTVGKVELAQPELIDEYMRVRALWSNGGKIQDKKSLSEHLHQWLVHALIEKRDTEGVAPWYKSDVQGGKWFWSKTLDDKGNIDPKFTWKEWRTFKFENENIVEENASLWRATGLVNQGGRDIFSAKEQKTAEETHEDNNQKLKNDWGLR